MEIDVKMSGLDVFNGCEFVYQFSDIYFGDEKLKEAGLTVLVIKDDEETSLGATIGRKEGAVLGTIDVVTNSLYQLFLALAKQAREVWGTGFQMDSDYETIGIGGFNKQGNVILNEEIDTYSAKEDEERQRLLQAMFDQISQETNPMELLKLSLDATMSGVVLENKVKQGISEALDEGDVSFALQCYKFGVEVHNDITSILDAVGERLAYLREHDYEDKGDETEVDDGPNC
jgi:hypothetical protein